ncbi:MAG: fibronectin type III domain-containing protein [Candidatus Saccharimonadales bacterium]
MRYHYSEALSLDASWGKKMFIGFSALAVAAVGAFSLVRATYAASEIIVSPTNPSGWTVDAGDGGSATIVSDTTAPGDAAYQLSDPDTIDAYAQIMKSVDLTYDQVQNLSYMSKTLGGPDYASASFAIGLDTDNNGSVDNYYVYEPYWQNDLSPGPAPVILNEWQTWNVLSGKFWDAGGGAPFYTWDEIKTNNPTAKVVEVAVYIGTYNPNFVVNVDNVTINDTTYNFELTSPDTQAPIVPAMLGWANPATMCGGTTSSYAITATWAASTDDTAVAGYEYQVMTPLRTTWESAWTTNVSGTSYSRAFTEGEGTYTYRVRAYDAAGNFSGWSDSCAITYDQTPAPTTKEQCKNDGWKLLFTTDNKPFKNQGACVSYVVANDNAKFKRQ